MWKLEKFLNEGRKILFTFLEKIEIVFENVEWIEVPAKFISALNMYDIKNFRRSFKNFDESLAVGKFTRADKIFIEIDKSAKEKFFSNAGAEISSRIASYQDITSFDLKYLDGSEEKIYTAWKGTDETNNLQKNYFDEEGNLIVKIGKDFEK